MADAALHELIAGCKAGDERSFRRLMEQFQPPAYRLAFRMLCDDDEARDAVQQSFIKIWRGIGSFDPGRAFTTWMYAIVSNVCLDHLREKRRRAFTYFRRDDEAVADERVDEALSDRQLAEIIRSLTERLPAKQQLVFTLRDLEDMPVDEVVRVTGMSRDVVKANLWHARKTIREFLRRDQQRGGGLP